MASLLETLIDVLDKENSEYQILLGLSQDKTDKIVKADLDGLQDIVGKEQKIIDRITLLEKQREESVADICNVLNIPKKDMKMDLLIKMLEKQPDDQRKLIEVHDKLKTTLGKMVKINDSNKAMLQESLDMVEFEINLARSSQMAPEVANYGKSANSTYGNMSYGTGGFDAKQ